MNLRKNWIPLSTLSLIAVSESVYRANTISKSSSVLQYIIDILESVFPLNTHRFSWETDTTHNSLRTQDGVKKYLDQLKPPVPCRYLASVCLTNQLKTCYWQDYARNSLTNWGNKILISIHSVRQRLLKCSFFLECKTQNFQHFNHEYFEYNIK